MDPRHLKRIQIVQNLFSYSYTKDKKSIPFGDEKKTIAVIGNLNSIDKQIAGSAPKYPVEKIAKTDLSILRLAVYELVIEKKLPEKVIINEAIELAKELSSEKSFGFVNAVLGKILNNKNR